MSSREAASPVRIVFLTRDPVLHERSGSTTYIVALLELLRRQGAQVTVLATTAESRSPRLAFRAVARFPEGVRFVAPGYRRLGAWYLLPLRLRAWGRAASRLALRRRFLRWLPAGLQRIFGDRLFQGAWDLTPPTPAEVELAVREIDRVDADVVLANYCLWGPLLGDPRLRGRRTAILMHDLLAARVRRFEESGTPLDMPYLTEDEELRWLSGADTVLAAQPAEAEAIRGRVQARVLVAPVMLSPRALPEEAVMPGRCLFVGSNIAPNRTALAFLLEAVWPRVRTAVPGATLAVAGTVGRALDEGSRSHGLASRGVEVLGVVPDLQAEYARAAVCVVPLRMGTGIKIKLLEALGFGKAIVSTSVGVQGMEAWAAEAIAVADDAERFAEAIVRLLTGDALRHERQAAALRLAAQHFGPDRPLDPAFHEALLQRREPPAYR